MKAVVLLLGLSVAGFAADRDFDRLVDSVESHYGVHRTHIPFLGVASFWVKLARPAGASSFDLAIFENLRFSAGPPVGELHRLVEGSLGAEWLPMVRVYSRREEEWTGIYTRVDGADIAMTIATFERHEGTLVKLKLNADDMRAWIEKPVWMARHAKTRVD